MMTRKTKTDKNILIRTFLWSHCFSFPCRFDCNVNGGVIIIFGEDIPLNLLVVELY